MLFHLARDQRGATLIEFALIAPLFLMLLLGAVQVAVAAFALGGLELAVGDAARFAQINPAATAEQIRGKIIEGAIGFDPARLADVQVTQVPVGGMTQTVLRVSYSVDWQIPFVPLPHTTVTVARRLFNQR